MNIDNDESGLISKLSIEQVDMVVKKETWLCEMIVKNISHMHKHELIKQHKHPRSCIVLPK
jgi:hypothetical protein